MAQLHATDRMLTDKITQLQTLAARASFQDALGRHDSLAVAAASERAAMLRARASVRQSLETEERASSYNGQKLMILGTLETAATDASTRQLSRVEQARRLAMRRARELRRSQSTDPASLPKWQTGPPSYYLVGRRPTPLGESSRAPPVDRSGWAKHGSPWKATGSGRAFGEPPAPAKLHLGGIGARAGPIDVLPPKQRRPEGAAVHARPWTSAVSSGAAFHEFAYNRPPTAHESKVAALQAQPDRLHYAPEREGKPGWVSVAATPGKGAAASFFSTYRDEAAVLGEHEDAAAARMGLRPGSGRQAAVGASRALTASARQALLAADRTAAAAVASAVASAEPQRGSGAGATWRGGSPGLVPRAGTVATRRLSEGGPVGRMGGHRPRRREAAEEGLAELRAVQRSARMG